MVYFILGILILLFLPFYDPKEYSWYLKQCHNGGLDRLFYRSCLSSHFSDIPTTVRVFCRCLSSLCWLPGFGRYFQNDDQTEKINGDVIFKALWAF